MFVQTTFALLMTLFSFAAPDGGSDKAQPEAVIEDMAWLAGHWLGEGLGGISEEIWSPPQAGTMMGVYRSIKEDKVTFYEFLAIVEEQNSLAMRLKHFTPAFVGWEEKEDFLSWPLEELSGTEAKFGPLTLTRTGNDLSVTLWMKNKKGERYQEKFHFKRVTD